MIRMSRPTGAISMYDKHSASVLDARSARPSTRGETRTIPSSLACQNTCIRDIRDLGWALRKLVSGTT